jgi:hypothetical protein
VSASHGAALLGDWPAVPITVFADERNDRSEVVSLE